MFLKLLQTIKEKYISVLVRVLQRNRTKRIYRDRKTYKKRSSIRIGSQNYGG